MTPALPTSGFDKGNDLCNSGMLDEALKAYEHALSIDGSMVDIAEGMIRREAKVKGM